MSAQPGFFAKGAPRAAYVEVVLPTLALYPRLFFLGREAQPRCAVMAAGLSPAAYAALGGAGGVGCPTDCYCPALRHEFGSAAQLGAFLQETGEEAFMLHAAHAAPQLVGTPS